MINLDPYIERASAELTDRSLRQVQVETAMTWAGRAIAARMMGSPDMVEYAHEAVEHAALTGDVNLLEALYSEFLRHGVPIS